MPTLFVQPPFDPHMQTVLSPMTGNAANATALTRGFMYWAGPTYPTGYSSPAQINFLFNPSTITTSYVLQDSGAQAALNFPNAAEPLALAVPLNQQCEFSLLFDRTYEMTVDLVAGDIALIGVDVDVRAVRQFTGMYATDYTDIGSAATAGTGGAAGTADVDNSGATGVAGGLTQGLMQMVPAFLYFATPNSGLMYYGYIDSWDVIYTHFNLQMIPMRCEVDISFTFLPPPPGANAASAGAVAAGNALGAAAGGAANPVGAVAGR
jgi:hypothetical protein